MSIISILRDSLTSLDWERKYAAGKLGMGANRWLFLWGWLGLLDVQLR